MKKLFLLLSIGKVDKSFKRQLSRYSCDNVIIDGDLSSSNLITELFDNATHRRCIYHIPRQVARLLYMHKVPIKYRAIFLYALIGILKNKDFYKAISEYFWLY